MGSKKINEYQLVSAGSMTGTSVITSSIQNVQNFDNLGLQLSWTGTPVGFFEVQSSIDGVNFTDLSGFVPPLPTPAGSGDTALININNLPFPYLRVLYTNTSGTGTLNVFINSKDLN